MISVESKGSFKFIEAFFKRMRESHNMEGILNRYGKLGVDALSSNTPIDSGRTSEMWGYEIHSSGSSYEIIWTNDNVNDGVNIALIIQYGHGTRNGAYVEGVDYINPAIRGVFDGLAADIWKEVQDA